MKRNGFNPEQKNTEFIILLMAVFTLCFAGVLFAGEGNQATGKAGSAAPLKSEKSEPASGTAPSSGPAGAPVTIIEFSDFQCPFCARASKRIEEVKKHYGDRVRIEFRNFPLKFHPNAQLAAEAAVEAARQGKFAEYKKLLFENQRNLTSENLIRFAEELGLDMNMFKGALNNRVHQRTVEQDIEAGKALGVRGTPTFVINGQLVVGAKPLEAFIEVIDGLLEQTSR